MWRTNHNNRKCRWPIILSLMNERLQAAATSTSCAAFKKQPHWTIDHFEALTITNQKYKTSIFTKDTMFFSLWNIVMEYTAQFFSTHTMDNNCPLDISTTKNKHNSNWGGNYMCTPGGDQLQTKIRNAWHEITTRAFH